MAPAQSPTAAAHRGWQDSATIALASAIGRTVDSAATGAFPIGLLAAALVFLLVQGRFDRSDAKLTQAQVASDDGLEFGAPPSFAPAETEPTPPRPELSGRERPLAR